MTKKETALTEKLNRATREASRRPKRKKKLSKKAQEMSEFLQTEPFGCKSEAAARFASIMLGVKIVITPLNHVIGTVIVPLQSGHSHDYPIGKPVLIGELDDDGSCYRGIRMDGTKGNHLDRVAEEGGELTRFATKAEIATLVKALLARKTRHPLLDS